MHDLDASLQFYRDLLGLVETDRYQSEEGQFTLVYLAAQVRQALENTMEVLAEAGARGEHITRMTWYVTDKQAYLDNLREVGAAYAETVGRNYPAMTLVQVTALVEDRARVEIETTAVVPE